MPVVDRFKAKVKRMFIVWFCMKITIIMMDLMVHPSMIINVPTLILILVCINRRCSSPTVVVTQTN